jgi:hypothetical protein
MKLRLFENSLRLRLTPAEVAQFADHKQLTGETVFGPTSRLRYSLRASPTATAIVVSYDSSNITVDVPLTDAAKWARGGDVSLSTEQKTTPGDILKISVEKDFECLDLSRNEPGVEFYPNPKRST